MPAKTMGRTPTIVTALLFVLLVVLILYPNLATIWISLRGPGGALAGFGEFVDPEHPAGVEALWTSLWTSAVSTLLAGILGTGAALLVGGCSFRGRGLARIAAAAPLALPPLVGVFSFYFLLGSSGILPRGLQALLGDWVTFQLSGVGAVLVVHAYSFSAYFFLFVEAALLGLDASAVEAARSLGARPLRVLLRVILPLLAPALRGAALLTFMSSMASFSAPFLFATSSRFLSVEIYNRKLEGNWRAAAVESLVLAAVSLTGLVLARGRLLTAPRRGAPRTYRSRPQGILAVALTLGMGLFSLIWLLPHLTVILLSFAREGSWTVSILPLRYGLENYTHLASDPRAFSPIGNSLRMALFATAAAVVVGVAAAHRIVAGGRIGRLLDLLAALPWALPGTVLAFNLLAAFGLFQIGGWRLSLMGSALLLPLAYFIRHLPLVVRATHGAFASLDRSLMEAALSLGARPRLAFRRVALPLLWPGIAAGALLAWVSILGEFVASILLWIPSNQPISMEIYSRLRIYDFGGAAAYGSLLIVLVALALAISPRLRANLSSG